VERETQHPEDAVGAVDERQPLLGSQGDRAEPGARQGGRRRLRASTGGPHLTLADERQRAVAERCKVAAGTERPVFANDRRDAVPEQCELQVDELSASPRVAHRQAASTHQQQRAYDLGFHRIAHAGGM
jgi:hypothetical protein